MENVLTDNKLMYDDEVAQIIANTGQKSDDCFTTTIDFFKRVLTPPKLFLFTSISAGLCMILFAGTLQHHEPKCKIFSTYDRCCSCMFKNSTAEYQDETVKTQLFYSILMMISACFAMYHAIRGVQTENRFHLLCFACSMGLFVGRAIFMLTYGLGADKNVVLVFLVFGVLSTFLSCLLIYPTYKRFGWRMFRKTGAKKHMRDMYKTYEKFMAFVRLDMQFHTLVFGICGCYLTRDRIWIVVVFAAVSYAWNFMIHRIAKMEHRLPFIFWMICVIITPIWWLMTYLDYLTCYRDFEVSRRDYVFDINHYTPPSYLGTACLAPDVQHDRYVWEAFIVVLVNACVFRVILLVVGVQVLRNFGKGLKEQMFMTKDIDNSEMNTEAGDE